MVGGRLGSVWVSVGRCPGLEPGRMRMGARDAADLGFHTFRFLSQMYCTPVIDVHRRGNACRPAFRNDIQPHSRDVSLLRRLRLGGGSKKSIFKCRGIRLLQNVMCLYSLNTNTYHPKTTILCSMDIHTLVHLVLGTCMPYLYQEIHFYIQISTPNL